MSTAYELPLTPQPQSFQVAIAGVTYQMRLTYCQPAGTIDVSSVPGLPIFAWDEENPDLAGLDESAWAIAQIALQDAASWVLDISDVSNNPILQGIPLVTGGDLLEPFGYLNLGFQLIAQSDFDPSAPPTFDNLGTTGHLYVVVP